jgi:hypothetical protein
MIGRFWWVAGADGIAHAQAAHGHPVRTACGAPASDDRSARRELSRCPRCLAILGLAPWPAT